MPDGTEEIADARNGLKVGEARPYIQIECSMSCNSATTPISLLASMQAVAIVYWMLLWVLDFLIHLGIKTVSLLEPPSKRNEASGPG